MFRKFTGSILFFKIQIISSINYNCLTINFNQIQSLANTVNSVQNTFSDHLSQLVYLKTDFTRLMYQFLILIREYNLMVEFMPCKHAVSVRFRLFPFERINLSPMI